MYKFCYYEDEIWNFFFRNQTTFYKDHSLKRGVRNKHENTLKNINFGLGKVGLKHQPLRLNEVLIQTSLQF